MNADDIFNRLADKTKQDNLEIRVAQLEKQVKTLHDLILNQCSINKDLIDVLKTKV